MVYPRHSRATKWIKSFFFFPSKLQLFPQAPLSAWSARTGAPYGRPSPGWSWRTSGSSVCETSFRQPTAARTGRFTSSLAVTSDAAAACTCRGTIRRGNRFQTGQDSLSLPFQREVKKRKRLCRWSNVLNELTRGHMTKDFLQSDQQRSASSIVSFVLTKFNSAVRKIRS